MICFMQFIFAESAPDLPPLTCRECPLRKNCRNPNRKEASDDHRGPEREKLPL